MGTFIRLFLIGLVVVIVFKVAAAMLPLVLLGLTVVLLHRYFGDKRKNEVVVRTQK